MVVPRGSDAVRIARRCWVSPQHADDLVRVCAEVLASSDVNSVIVGTTAARLHNLWLPNSMARIEVATATPGRPVTGMTRSKRPEFTARRVVLDADEICVVDGIRVTTLARTWRDLAKSLELPALVAAGDSALRSGTTLEEVGETIRRGRHVRGIRRARAAAELLDERSRSRPESHLRVAAGASGRFSFAVNAPVYRETGGWLAEPDLSLDDAKIALEYQGAEHASVDRMRRDMTRFADLRAEGWLVLAYGPAEVFRRPWLIEGEVEAAIRTRAPHLLAAAPR